MVGSCSYHSCMPMSCLHDIHCHVLYVYARVGTHALYALYIQDFLVGDTLYTIRLENFMDYDSCRFYGSDPNCGI